MWRKSIRNLLLSHVLLTFLDSLLLQRTVNCQVFSKTKYHKKILTLLMITECVLVRLIKLIHSTHLAKTQLFARSALSRPTSAHQLMIPLRKAGACRTSTGLVASLVDSFAHLSNQTLLVRVLCSPKHNGHAISETALKTQLPHRFPLKKP